MPLHSTSDEWALMATIFSSKLSCTWRLLEILLHCCLSSRVIHAQLHVTMQHFLICNIFKQYMWIVMASGRQCKFHAPLLPSAAHMLLHRYTHNNIHNIFLSYSFIHLDWIKMRLSCQNIFHWVKEVHHPFICHRAFCFMANLFPLYM